MTRPADVGRRLADLKGVGQVRARLFNDRGLATVADLLGLLPRRYRLLPEPRPVSEWRPGDLATVVAEVRRSRLSASRRRGPGHLQVVLGDGRDELLVDFYNQGFLRDRFEKGRRVLVSGRLKEGQPPAIAPLRHRILGLEEEEPEAQRILLEYPTLEGLKPGQLQGLVREALLVGLDDIDDPLDVELRSRRELPLLRDAVRAAHEPRDLDELAAAERRFVYNACLVAALRVESARTGRQLDGASPMPRDADRERALRAIFPFALTAAQDRALETIYADLAGPRPMRRLLQGDVGSGKTAVALAAAFGAVRAGRQAALMAPTEVLARQLQAEAAKLAAPLGIVTALVLGRQKAAERRELAAGLGRGEIGIAVGTQALFGRGLDYAALGLVVVDEQHRFGVMQRLKLVRKGAAPHLLAMSATPIPRSLAMTIYSDLDLSVLDERPPGRKGIRTRIHSHELDGPYDWSVVAEEAKRGEKAYVVFPAVESEEASIPSLFVDGRRIAARFFRGIRVAALHGRMDDEEKGKNLEAFRRGDVRVLFATTVIEVGVDVPDARRIVIVGAGRFGLAQLHQLRGRVGRGGAEGLCDLLVKSRKAAESERLRLLEETEDGFRIAERDLELRGPGDMMGLKQHGVLPLMRTVDDEGLLYGAFEDARHLIEQGADVDELIAGLAGFVRDRRGPSSEYMEAG